MLATKPRRKKSHFGNGFGSALGSTAHYSCTPLTVFKSVAASLAWSILNFLLAIPVYSGGGKGSAVIDEEAPSDLTWLPRSLATAMSLSSRVNHMQVAGVEGSTRSSTTPHAQQMHPTMRNLWRRGVSA